INVGGVEMMLHADHTYDKHPWYAPLTRGERRGLGAELRVFGIDPDAIERRAREHGATVVQPAATKGHGWREVMVEDPDGYLWAVGVPGPSKRGWLATSTRRCSPTSTSSANPAALDHLRARRAGADRGRGRADRLLRGAARGRRRPGGGRRDAHSAVHRLPEDRARRDEQAHDRQGRLRPAPDARAVTAPGRGAVGRSDAGRAHARLRHEHAHGG